MNDNVNLFRTPHVDCYSSTLTLYFSTVSVSASVVHQWLHKKCIFDVLRGFLKDIRNGYVELYRTLEYRIKKESPVIIYRVYRVYRVYRLYRLYRVYREYRVYTVQYNVQSSVLVTCMNSNIKICALQAHYTSIQYPTQSFYVFFQIMFSLGDNDSEEDFDFNQPKSSGTVNRRLYLPHLNI